MLDQRPASRLGHSSRERLRVLPRTRLLRPVALGLLAIALVAAIVCTAVVPQLGYLHRAAIWGVVVLVSMAGWGGLVDRLVFASAGADLGLRLAWGMASVIGLGGVLCVLSLAIHPVLFGIVLAGVALEYAWQAGRWLAPSPPRLPSYRWSTGAALAAVVVGILLILQYYGGAAAARLTPDDYVVYLVFPKKILATGTLIEPFSVRRLAAYGGQSLLQALTLIGTDNILQVTLVDFGIALVAVVALVLGDRRQAWAALWLPALLVVTIPNIHTNSTSLWSGVALFLVLFRTASWEHFASNPKRGAALLGLLAASFATLRLWLIVPAAAFLALFYAPALWRAWRGPGGLRALSLAVPAIAAAAMLVWVLPWALLSYQSNGTLLLPLFDGYYRPEYGRMTAATLEQHIEFLWINARRCHPVRSIPLFTLAALLVPWRAERGALAALTWASVLGFVAIVWGFPLSDEVSIARYYFPLVVALSVAVCMHVGTLNRADWQRAPLRAGLPAALVLVAMVWQFVGLGKETYQSYAEFAALIRDASREPSLLAPRDYDYRLLQAKIPDGAPLLTMLDRPFWFDFRRNRIDVLDLPGQVSPPPGLPLDDDDALVDYLGAQGFRYVAFMQPDASDFLYRRKRWEKLLGPLSPALWRDAAPRYLKLFDRFASLQTTRVRLYDDGKMVALDLGRRIGD